NGSPTLSSVVCTRQGTWDGTPRGRATVATNGSLVGYYAYVYRVLYIPQDRPGTDWDPDIEVRVHNLTARYIYAVNGTPPVAAPVFTVPDRVFTFQLPTNPQVRRQPNGGLACLGGTYTISPLVVGFGTLQHQWYNDGAA